MKKLLISAILGMATVVAFGQGAVTINTTGSGAYARYTNTVGNSFASGSSFVAGLYWATDAATLASGGGTLVTGGGVGGSGLANFTTGAGAGFVNSASLGGNRTITERAAQLTFFQLRAWSATFATYAAAVASGDAATLITPLTGPGSAPIVSATPAATASSPVPAIQWAPGTTASGNAIFVDLVPVPEPSTLALVGLGLAGLYFIRRRK